MDIKLPYQWSPRPFQRPLWNYLSTGGSRAVANWPRRHGKDDVFLRHASCAMGERKGNYWYLLPEYSQARKSMWDAINEETGIRRIDEAFPEKIRSIYREQEMMVGYAGSTFQLVGADNFHSLVGSPPVGLVFSEYARTNPSAWAYLMPILEKNGGWVGFNSTPFGNNHYRRLCDYAERQMAEGKDWFYQKLTAPECGVYSDQQLAAILEQLQEIHGDDYGKSLYLQEYFTSFDAAIPGAIYGDCLDKAKLSGRVTNFPFDPLAMVYTAWDLGHTDDTAIWFYQLNGAGIDLIDYHSSSLKDIDFYVALLQAKAKEFGYRFATHYVPHDARPRTLAAGGKSILQQFSDAAKLDQKLGRFVIVKRLDKQEGIQAARKTFPRCRFHATHCKNGLEALANYHREWDTETRTFSVDAAHDWSSHGADAFRYLSLSWRMTNPQQPDSPLVDKLMKGDESKQTWGAMRAAHFSKRKQARALANS